jgi:hypothetical protein
VGEQYTVENCFNIPVILQLCASLWNNKKCFDTVDARYKHEDSFCVSTHYNDILCNKLHNLEIMIPMSDI